MRRVDGYLSSTGPRRRTGGGRRRLRRRRSDLLPPFQPVVPDRVRRRHPVVRIHFEAAPEEVDEDGIRGGLLGAAAAERRHEVARHGRATEPTAFRVAARDEAGAAVVDRLDAVARHAAARDELAFAFARRQVLLARHTEHLEDAGDLVELVFAGEQREPGQQLHHDTTCS